MQEPAQQGSLEIAREAKQLAQRLKEASKGNAELDKELEFQRKNLRKQYLKLLLLHPSSKEAKDAETHIWMQTSYQFISIYKQKIAVLDQKLSTRTKGTTRQDYNGGGPVEYRKLVARFRQFLGEEEKFYAQLLIRFQTQFELKETHGVLVKVGVLSVDPDEVRANEGGRNIFPEEEITPCKSVEEHRQRLATFTKLLVCLGDIARYREQYNDGRGRSRGGNDRKGKRTAQEVILRPKNYGRAQIMYEQARLLVPDDGNASHQLAILASYQKDSFASLLHYYRALCVRQPYDTASNNMNTVLKKALEQFRQRNNKEGRDRVERYKELVVVLHGFWYLDSDEAAARASKLATSIVTEFTSLVSDRELPSGMICDTLMLAIGALWKIRMIRDGQVRSDRKVIEPLMASHILNLSRSMLKVSKKQLEEKPEDETDLAQKITAAFRRLLPALRIGSKWLRSNYGFLETSLAAAATSDAFLSAIKSFWEAYALFFSALRNAFPKEKLPQLAGPLEEDVYMSGFSPIKKDLLQRIAATENGLAPGQDTVHPNEEYLMRLSDLWNDFHLLKDAEKTPIVEKNGQYTFEISFRTNSSALKSPPAETLANIMESHPEPPRIAHDSDDDNTTQTSRTEDDVIREAFDAALGDEEDDEEDEIVWSPPRLSLSLQSRVVHPPQGSPQPTTAACPPVPKSPPEYFPTGIPAATTAQDLLNNVLGFSRTNGEPALRASSSAPQASMLFGSGTLGAPTKSIWTTDSGLRGANVPKRSLLSQSNQIAVSGSYIGQERRQSLSHIQTPPANGRMLPGSSSLGFYASAGNLSPPQMKPHGVPTSEMYGPLYDLRTTHSAAPPGQAFDERYVNYTGQQYNPIPLQPRQDTFQNAYTTQAPPIQRAWNT